MTTQQSNESTGKSPIPTGENNAKPNSEQDNGGGGSNKLPSKGKKTRNRKNKNNKTNTTKVNEYYVRTDYCN